MIGLSFHKKRLEKCEFYKMSCTIQVMRNLEILPENVDFVKNCAWIFPFFQILWVFLVWIIVNMFFNTFDKFQF